MTHKLLHLTFCTALATAALFATGLALAEQPESLWVYVGTYTGGESKGIYLCRLDLATGRLTGPELAAEVASPSFLALHPTGKFLYAVGETGAGSVAGAVHAFAIESEAGQLSHLNTQPSGGAGPCHLVVDAAGRNVLVANYGGGSVAVLPIGDDGRLAEPSCVVQHEGSSVNPQRQEAPHAHSINLDPANRFAFAADLGLDQVLVYRFDAHAGTLVPNDPAFAKVAPGAGPRHFAFHPAGTWAYVINELANTVTAFSYDAQHGVLKEIQTISTLPADFKEPSYTAEVVVHPSGKFLYGSNRGHDSLAIFSIDGHSGKLKLVGHEPTGGKTPRNFAAEPTGKYVLTANQASDSVFVFEVDMYTGKLKRVGEGLKVPTPVCLRFLAPKR
jgi:6-phosphogluconolactonase